MIVRFPGAYPPNEGTRARTFSRSYDSDIELEITPEPTGDERSAIAAALVEEDAAAPEDGCSAWRRAGIEAETAPDVGYGPDATL